MLSKIIGQTFRPSSSPWAPETKVSEVEAKTDSLFLKANLQGFEPEMSLDQVYQSLSRSWAKSARTGLIGVGAGAACFAALSFAGLPALGAGLALVGVGAFAKNCSDALHDLRLRKETGLKSKSTSLKSLRKALGWAGSALSFGAEAALASIPVAGLEVGIRNLDRSGVPKGRKDTFTRAALASHVGGVLAGFGSVACLAFSAAPAIALGLGIASGVGLVAGGLAMTYGTRP